MCTQTSDFLIYKQLIRPRHLKSYLECVHVAMAL